jgi:hypothetical protein
MSTKYIERFIKSLKVDPSSCLIKNVVTLSTQEINETNKMELYHGTRGCMTTSYNVNKTTEKILKEGFRLPIFSNYTNKRDGIYFSSHARYQYLWLTDEVPIFICDVIYKEGKVRRYRAQVSTDWEFCVTDPKLIIPRYLIYYEIQNDMKQFKESKEYQQFRSVYIPHGQFGCKECDAKVIRCDCEQFPTFGYKD